MTDTSERTHPRRDHASWDEAYRQGQTPWDTGAPSPHLIAFLDAHPELKGNALELGCGTGTNAVLLAQRGFSVVAVDIAPRAIEMARARAEAAGVAGAVRFVEADILAGLPVEPGSMDFAFDRGVFHAVKDEDKPTFARRVYDALRPGAFWVSLSGNADEPERPEMGPPRVKAVTLVASIEPFFAIKSLKADVFDKVEGSPWAWVGAFARR